MAQISCSRFHLARFLLCAFLLLCVLALLAGATPALAQAIPTATPTSIGAAIVVNDMGDDPTAGDGKCTLREAITNANSNSDTTSGDCTAGSNFDTITFSVGGTIQPGSALPTIIDNLTIDGSPSRWMATTVCADCI